MALRYASHFARVEDLEGLENSSVAQLPTQIEILNDVAIWCQRKILIDSFNSVVARLLGGVQFYWNAI